MFAVLLSRDMSWSFSLSLGVSHDTLHMLNSIYLVVLEGPVDLLDVGKDNFWVESPGADHLVHVVPRYEVRDSR